VLVFVFTKIEKLFAASFQLLTKYQYYEMLLMSWM